MAAKGTPARGLAVVELGDAAADRIPGVPQEPAARYVAPNPALFAPHHKRQAALDPKIVEFWVGSLGDMSPNEPFLRQLGLVIVSVLTLEDAEFQHISRRRVGSKPRSKSPPGVATTSYL